MGYHAGKPIESVFYCLNKLFETPYARIQHIKSAVQYPGVSEATPPASMYLLWVVWQANNICQDKLK